MENELNEENMEVTIENLRKENEELKKELESQRKTSDIWYKKTKEAENKINALKGLIAVL